MSFGGSGGERWGGINGFPAPAQWDMTTASTSSAILPSFRSSSAGKHLLRSTPPRHGGFPRDPVSRSLPFRPTEQWERRKATPRSHPGIPGKLSTQPSTSSQLQPWLPSVYLDDNDHVSRQKAHEAQPVNNIYRNNRPTLDRATQFQHYGLSGLVSFAFI